MEGYYKSVFLTALFIFISFASLLFVIFAKLKEARIDDFLMVNVIRVKGLGP